jgi:hypothetical protein
MNDQLVKFTYFLSYVVYSMTKFWMRMLHVGSQKVRVSPHKSGSFNLGEFGI